MAEDIMILQLPFQEHFQHPETHQFPFPSPTLSLFLEDPSGVPKHHPSPNLCLKF